MDHAEKALEYSKGNFNCAQSVFSAFALELGMDEKTALRLATCFGGGARKGEMCGAVSGALMVLGLMYGHDDGPNKESKKWAYAMTVEFMNRFMENNGSVVCRDLLGLNLGREEDLKRMRELNLYKTFCPKMIESACGILDAMISERR